MRINERTNNLDNKTKKELEEILTYRIKDKDWCIINSINHRDPDIRKAREIVYDEFYGRYFA